MLQQLTGGMGLELHVKGLPKWMNKMNPDKMSSADRHHIVSASSLRNPPPPDARLAARRPRHARARRASAEAPSMVRARGARACRGGLGTNRAPDVHVCGERHPCRWPARGARSRATARRVSIPSVSLTMFVRRQMHLQHHRDVKARKACLETEKNGARCIF